jgi:hypothetical protein
MTHHGSRVEGQRKRLLCLFRSKRKRPSSLRLPGWQTLSRFLREITPSTSTSLAASWIMATLISLLFYGVAPSPHLWTWKSSAWKTSKWCLITHSTARWMWSTSTWSLMHLTFCWSLKRKILGLRSSDSRSYPLLGYKEEKGNLTSSQRLVTATSNPSDSCTLNT